MPNTVLHIDSSARFGGSVTRDLSAQIVAHLAPASVIRRDLADALPLIAADWVAANLTPADQRTPEQRAALALSDNLVEELRAADCIVIGAPIYNFGIPAGLKAWIDLVARAGLTFRYTETGPEGLLSGKRAIIALASGGTQVGSAADYASGYLRHVLGFIGITDVEIVAADRLMFDAEGAIAGATSQIGALAA